MVVEEITYKVDGTRRPEGYAQRTDCNRFGNVVWENQDELEMKDGKITNIFRLEDGTVVKLIYRTIGGNMVSIIGDAMGRKRSKDLIERAFGAKLVEVENGR